MIPSARECLPHGPDMEEEMIKNSIPLFSLETHSPMIDFDIIGITLQYEMSYSNILYMLKLSGFPLLASERDERYPLICAGGPCAYNPEPLSDFIDFFTLGEGEESTNEIMDTIIACKEKNFSKTETLFELSKIEGIYVPSFYEVEYENEKIKSFKPKRNDVPATIRKRIIKDMDKVYFPDRVIVPYMEVVHDRLNLELFRGCIRGCRFCQAGIIYRPVRERSKERLLEIAEKLIKNTGYEEISLTSLSTSDYSDLPSFTSELIDLTEKRMINLSLPSLRIDNFTLDLMQKVQKVRKSGLTFAPEAGTQRMRDIINKGITEEDILKSAKIAFEGGYKSIKLYFMIGLPFETMEDVEGINILAKNVLDTYFEIPREKGEKGVNITVSVSSFVPKPFTPFQFAKQNTIEELREKQHILKSTVKSKRINLNYHESKLSILEGVFARGDRRLGAVLKRANELGCKFDGWSEFFDYEKWESAFNDCGIDISDYTRQRDYDEILPWDFIDVGVSKRFLINENEKAKMGRITPNCRQNCSGCGAGFWKAGVCIE